MYQPVVCGGDNKERDLTIQVKAEVQSGFEADSHPCGCAVCLSNILLANLYKLRVEAGINPYTGRSV